MSWKLPLSLCLLLLAAGTARADILTVGPAGDYATIQSAVDAALAPGGSQVAVWTLSSTGRPTCGSNAPFCP